MSLKPTSSLPLKTNPPPNFFSTYSVVLSVPPQEVYITLGTAAGHERVCRLSGLCTGFELLEKDTIALPIPAYPDGRRLKDVAVRTAAMTPETTDEGVQEGKDRLKSVVVTRQHFKMEESVPMLFGLFKVPVLLNGTFSWDESALSKLSSTSSTEEAPLEALYESISNQGIIVWKLRTFEAVDGMPSKTKVSERIEGWAPALLRPIVQREAEKGHRAHMELYHTLF